MFGFLFDLDILLTLNKKINQCILLRCKVRLLLIEGYVGLLCKGWLVKLNDLAKF